MKRFLTLFSIIIIAVIGACLLRSTAYSVSYGEGSYGACDYSSCSISLSSDVTVAVDITPIGSTTTCTVASDHVSVGTGSSTGYTLSISSSDATNSLNGSNGGTIAATSGNPSSPSLLTSNKWGYRVDDIASFGSGPTSATSNTGVPTASFALLPLYGSVDTIATISTLPSNPAVTTVWYGVCADTTIPAGTYTIDVIYTAVVN